MWFIRFFADENELVNWIYVLFSNFTMLGPVIVYWVSIVLILIGWAVDSFDLVDSDALLKWFTWIVLSFFASFYQVAWIDEVRTVYSGDRWTFEDEISDLQDSTEDTIQENNL